MDNRLEDVADLPELPEAYRSALAGPFEGLFGDTVSARVLLEIVADPFRVLRSRELASWTGSSPPSVRKALKSLTELGLLTEDASRPRLPVYTANVASRRLLALTLLSFAVIDDHHGTGVMDEVIRDYAREQLGLRGTVINQVNFVNFNISSGPVFQTTETLAGSADVTDASYRILEQVTEREEQ